MKFALNPFIQAFGVVVGIILVAFVLFGKGPSSVTDSNGQIKRGPDIAEIGARADNLPIPVVIDRKNGAGNKTVTVNLKATQVIANLDNGTTYEYWTYNNQVPGPFIRVMEGDLVRISLTHEHAHAGADIELSDDLFSVNYLTSFATADEGHEDDSRTVNSEEAEHMAAGHGEHSIDLHSVLGPGGGAELTRVGPNETKIFEFKAMRPGLYIYHCASPHVPTHIANGMYGLILVEPRGGLSAVDKEFYVVEGELYTRGGLGEKGFQEFDRKKLLNERPEYFVFNGRKGSLTGGRALMAEVGETVRIFFGASGQVPSNFHIIGEIFDKLYPEGDIVSSPHRNVQTTIVPAGGAAMVEFKVEVPGRYLLVDHSLSRSIDRGALGELIVTGEERSDIIKKIK
ncbi:MAG: hypothetical protein A3B91_01830 [Candidatus Yanofskybacteria bacterium RIFCSPHIGHO2_02_FULL_41_29]|uniref:Plastocyanin-like domain-containing protein n=1 Tax=Candidatus Yanofskybacteria bacterium RIFCSPHIGHO2_01_FULL_41_53 TaxID=1802663 RepID=A0A1F8EH31_9BACT|nr:MAG: hypothetical protein A2650_04270 [Candidatus Yanofskybacteria bacterium RIFCSPHIGHO2_01_FULL_41_53]OGN11201.1 MAG: hypothetical protein A3B91_01830 [Candidatus Yanofskybacteria bacterium RIFCSPHIGHO2_02_FULL_41_29]OGN16948.1 MAG: hypothetical protein A3F48_00825 [Candidatus Yanofskybacteria bacterium RIFCSPHIGHO2_12_FULL_41_9]OGN22267.1 MAG: hypothetical protein A2916_04075 [Candidatus Yanofskybacteria bacterium RIFCSPLOWO2_01_FULL_41_67]OGN29635.1 MAG: hypothetical protein A3H54_00715 